MNQSAITDMDGFELGTPALVCRWRLANRTLPLENRHIRALLARRVQGGPVSKELAAWAKQHIEWTLERGAAQYPDGVLMLIVDDEGRAAMTVGPYEPLPETQLTNLEHRAVRAQQEAEKTLVAPETLWLVRNDKLLWDPGEDAAPSGVASLVSQLALTMGIDTIKEPNLLETISAGDARYDEAFLVSDEHGIVVASDATGRHGTRMAEGYKTLLERAR